MADAHTKQEARDKTAALRQADALEEQASTLEETAEAATFSHLSLESSCCPIWSFSGLELISALEIDVPAV